jgi:hypothetical protein
VLELGAPARELTGSSSFIPNLRAVAPNELLYKVIRDYTPLCVFDDRRLEKWVLVSYVRILDEEECLKETYHVRLQRILTEKRV